MIGKSTRVDWVSSMRRSSALVVLAAVDAEPDHPTPRRAHASPSRAAAPSSVVQTGVKSAGCENSTHQLSPMNSWSDAAGVRPRGEVRDAVADADVALPPELLLHAGEGDVRADILELAPAPSHPIPAAASRTPGRGA